MWAAHITRFCRYANRGQEKEAHGRQRDTAKSDPHVSAVTKVATPQTESVSPDVEEALTQYEQSLPTVVSTL